MDDKVTTEPEEYNNETRLKVVLRTMKNLIGEYSNYATAYRNRVAKTPEQEKKYQDYISIISVLTGKAVDFAKTGVLYVMPRYIAKYGRPLPHFMKYASPYYGKLKLSNTASNMNRLCRDLERWQKQIRFKRTDHEFDYTIMIDPEIEVAPETFEAMSRLYKSFCDDLKQLPEDIRDFTEEERKQAYIDLYDFYRAKCLAACGYDVRVVANAAVELCHQHKSWNQKFKWIVGGPGIVQNIKQTDIVLPERDDNGELEYLGKKYKLTCVKKEDVVVE